MNYKIEKIEGIGKEYADMLRKVDIQTTDDLLRRCADKKGRDGVAKESGVSKKMLLSWVNRADLMRVDGIGEEYADLLEEAGVDTVKELAVRKADNLVEKMDKINLKRKLVKKVPNLKTVESWIKQAEKMEYLVTH